jgi:protein-tyrosine phosphatase
MISMSIAQTLSTPNPPPIPDSYWVVPGRLLAGEYPGAKMEAEARRKLRLFLDAGVTCFLDLTEAGELAPYALLLQEEAAIKQIAVEHHRMPIPDLGTPAPAQVVRILDAIDAASAAGRRGRHGRGRHDCVYVHCWGGIGRTGTLVGCYLVRHGLTGPQALAELARLRQGTPDAWRASPETPAQQARVRAWPVGG